jgi:hypothetical protein
MLKSFCKTKKIIQVYVIKKINWIQIQQKMCFQGLFYQTQLS